jgi:BolA protein
MAADPRALEAALRDAFAPTYLDVEDESALHVGHAGAASGGGHYRVTIVSSAFAGKSRVARHRMVYDALRAFLPDQIHALAIAATTPEEPLHTTSTSHS